jgi:hypothetical protein
MIPSTIFYLGKILLPIRLMPLHPDLPSWWELLMGATVVLAGLTWGAWRWRRTYPLALWGWLWFAILLFPLSGVVWAGAERVATRWIYLPQAGLMLAAAASAADWIRSRGRTARWGAAVCMLVLAIWGGISLGLSRHWRDRDHFGIWVWECNPGHGVVRYARRRCLSGPEELGAGGGGLRGRQFVWDTHCFCASPLIWNCCGFRN